MRTCVKEAKEKIQKAISTNGQMPHRCQEARQKLLGWESFNGTV